MPRTGQVTCRAESGREGEKWRSCAQSPGIWRKTGDETFDRYEDCGPRPQRSEPPGASAGESVTAVIEATIVRLKWHYPGWDARKTREKLR